MEYKNVLVTGGTGFIGSHLVEALASKGKNVTVLVMKNPIDTQEVDNLEIIKNKCKIVYGDLRDKDSLNDAVIGADVVFHLGAISRPMKIPINIYYDINSNGTRNLLEASKQYGIKRFIHISSVSVLGISPDGHKLSENDYQEEHAHYGLSKKEGEKIALQFFRDHGLPVVILRPCLMYGPRCVVRLIMFKFVKLGLFPLFDNGAAKMEFCYVDNLIQAIFLSVEKDDIVGEIFNITDGESYEIRYILNTIAHEFGVRPPFIQLPFFIGKLMGYASESISKIIGIYPPFSSTAVEWMSKDRNVYDCSKAKRILGYTPAVRLEDGIARTIKWFKDNSYL